MKFKIIIVSILVSIISLINVSNATIIEIDPVFDGRIRDINGTPLLLDSDPLLEVFEGGGFETRTIMEFSLSGISGLISGAELWLPTATSIVGGTNISVFGYSGNGVLELADAFSGDFVGSFLPTTIGSHSINIDTSILQNVINGGASHFGLMLSVTSGGQAIWNHPQNSTIAKLKISTNSIPEPTTLAIFALGMIGLVSRRFKKQS